MTNQELQKLADLPKKERMQMTAQLLAEGKMTVQEYREILQPMIEAKRSIERVDGKIIRSKEFLQNRLQRFEEKEKNLTERLSNVQAEIKQLKSELKK